jgi:hypothetical protein
MPCERVLQHLRDHNHIALKGQTLVEQSLGRIIAQHCSAASVLDGVNIPFPIKSKLARALIGDSHGTALWDLVWRLYLIRTEIACRVDSPGVRRSIRKFIAEESRWAQTSIPTISSDSDLASGFAGSIESLLDVLAAVERRVQTNTTNSGPESS